MIFAERLIESKRFTIKFLFDVKKTFGSDITSGFLPENHVVPFSKKVFYICMVIFNDIANHSKLSNDVEIQTDGSKC